MKRFVLVAVLCAVGSSVMAQIGTKTTAAGDFLFDTRSHIRLGRGDVTWSAAATMAAPRGAESSANAYAALGYFLTDEFELEGSTLFQKLGPYQGESAGGGVNVYFREFFDYMYPYVGIGASKWFGDFSTQGTHFQAKVGVRYFFTDNLGLRVWIEYDKGDNLLYNSNTLYTGYVGIFSMSY